MTMMVTELYDALISAGADDVKAKQAAAALANYDDRFSRIETDMAVLKWMLGLVVTGVVALLIKAYL
jgi:hypothetical protein